MKKIFTIILLTYFVSTSYGQKLYSWLIVPEYSNSKVKVYAPGATATLNIELNTTGIINNINGVVLVGNDLYIASDGNSFGNNLKKYPNFVAAVKASTFNTANIVDAFAGVSFPSIIGIIEKNGVIYTTHQSKVIATTISNGSQNTLIDVGGYVFANLAFDNVGNLWITEYWNDRLYLILSSNLAMATNAKVGYFSFEQFANPTLPSSNTNSNLQSQSKTYISRPEGIDFDNDGNMYVANNNDNGFNSKTSIVKFSKSFITSLINNHTGSAAGVSGFLYNGVLNLNDAQIFNVPNSGASNSQLGGLKIDKNMNCLYVNEQVGGAGFSIDLEKIADISNNYNDIKLNITSTNPGNGGIFRVNNGIFCNAIANPSISQTFFSNGVNLTTSNDKVICKTANVDLQIGNTSTYLFKNYYINPTTSKTTWINSLPTFTFKASDYFWGRITTSAVGQCGSTTLSNMSNYFTDDSIKILRQPTDIVKPALNSTQNFNFDVTSYDNGNLMYLPVGFRWYRENVSTVHQFDSFIDGVSIPNLKIVYAPGFSTVTDTLTFDQVNYLGEGKYYCIATNHCNSVQTNLVNLIMKSRLNVLFSVSIPNQISSILNADAKTVEITMPFGTNVTSLVPTLAFSQFATCTPNSGVAQNFTNPVSYTITAEDGTTTVTYTVKVIVAPFEPLAGKEILTFSIPNQVGTSTINSANATIDISMPFGTNVTSLIPTFTLSPSATSDKASGIAQDFTNPVIYKITAQDATTKNWTVKVAVQTGSSIVENNRDQILVYPNPFQNELNIEENQNINRIEVYNLLGNKVIELNKPKEYKIDTKNWESGIYFLKIQSNNGKSNIQKISKH